MGGQKAPAEPVDRGDQGAAESGDQRIELVGRLWVAGLATPQLIARPLAQLGRGLVGEGEGEDCVGRDAVGGDQVAVAVDEHSGLAGAGARFEQDVAPAGADCGGLLPGRLP